MKIIIPLNCNHYAYYNVMLQAPEMVFQPSMEQEVTDGFCALVESLLDDVFNFASLVPRVAKHKDQPHYHSDVEEVSIAESAIHM